MKRFLIFGFEQWGGLRPDHKYHADHGLYIPLAFGVWLWCGHVTNMVRWTSPWSIVALTVVEMLLILSIIGTAASVVAWLLAACFGSHGCTAQ